MTIKIMEIDTKTNKTTVRQMTNEELDQYTVEQERIAAEEIQ